MLTRLRVKGFKNLVDVDVHFGPFTCVVGANGVGKSNLFDAIRFLSALADQPVLEAARLVRGGSGAVGGVREASFTARELSDAGRARWTLRLLVDRLVELAVVGRIDPATVCRTPQKTRSSLGSSGRGSSRRRRPARP